LGEANLLVRAGRGGDVVGLWSRKKRNLTFQAKKPRLAVNRNYVSSSERTGTSHDEKE